MTAPRSACTWSTSPRRSRSAPAAPSATSPRGCTRAPTTRCSSSTATSSPASTSAPWSPPTPTSGADVSLHLTRVEDPRAFGLVPTDAHRPGHRLPGEAADPRGDRHRPDQRGRVRLPPLGHRHHPGRPPGLRRTRDLPRTCSPPAPTSRAWSTPRTGSTSAPRRPSSAAPPTWSSAAPPPRPSPAAAATAWSCPTATVAADAKLTGGTVVGARRA